MFSKISRINKKTIIAFFFFLNIPVYSAVASDNSLESCKLPSLNSLYHQDVGWPRDPNSIPSKGIQKFLILGIDFSDAQLGQGYLDELPNLLELKTIKAFYASVSDNQFEPSFLIYPKMVTVDKSSQTYGSNLSNDSISNGEYQSHILIRDALDKISGLIDLNLYEGVIAVIGSGKSLSGDIASATSVDPDQMHPSGVIHNYIILGHDSLTNNRLVVWRMIVHEINHLLGITDLYLYSNDGWWQGKSPGPFGQQGFLQGDSASDSLAYNRWLRGWIPDKSVKCLNSINKSLVLSIHSQGSKNLGYEMVLFRINDNKLLVLESPRENGFSSRTHPRSILMYTVDNSIKIGEGPVRIVSKNDPVAVSRLSPSLPDWERYKNAALLVGDSVEFEKLLFVNTTTGNSGDTTQVKILAGQDTLKKVLKCVNRNLVKVVIETAPKCPKGYK